MTISSHLHQFYIDGTWVDPLPGAGKLGVENPATEEIVAEVALGTAADADRAILAARAAFDGYTAWKVADRIDLLAAVIDEYNRRYDEFAAAISLEMGAPEAFGKEAQAWAGKVHMESTLEMARSFHWEERR
ncbi:MAG: aldehyde dehydrogenase family protein, partial [Paracoccaceae bacterium]